MNPNTTDPIASPQQPLPIARAPNDANGRSLEHCEDEDHEEMCDYVAVPPRKSVAVLVRYRFRGRGQPLPYAVDEEEAE